MNEESLTPEQTKEVDSIQTQIEKAMDKDFIEDVTKNNTNEFIHNNIKYRVMKPTYEQKQEVYKERVRKFTQLLKDPSYALEKDLKKQYLLRDIDIDAMTKAIANLEVRKNAVQMKLGELLEKDGSDIDCQALKKEIESIQEEQRRVIIEKQDLLEFSIENQVILHIYNYLTYTITEKQEGNSWVKAFRSFDDFMKSEEVLINKLAFIVTVSYNDII